MYSPYLLQVIAKISGPVSLYRSRYNCCTLVHLAEESEEGLMMVSLPKVKAVQGILAKG